MKENCKFDAIGVVCNLPTILLQTAMSGIIQSGITKADIRMTAVFGTADLLAEEGELTLFVKDQKVAEEKYMVLWKKEDGRWKLFRDIFNSNLPALASH